MLRPLRFVRARADSDDRDEREEEDEGEDVFFAIEFDVLELQAVTPVWVFWFRRPANGWGLPARAAQQRYVDLVNDLAEEMLGLIFAGLLTTEEGEPELFHQAMVALAQEIGAGYGRWRRRTEFY